MKNLVTAEAVVAYSQCPRKAFLLLAREDSAEPHEYVRIVEEQARMNRAKYLNTLKHTNPGVNSFADNLESNGDFLVEVTLRAQDLEASCDILTKVPSRSSLGSHSYEPTLVVGTHEVTKEQKLGLLFNGYVLGQVQNKPPVGGTIVGMEGQAHKVRLERHCTKLRPIVDTLREWTATPSPEPPPVILNRHCPSCPFRDECKAQAERDDDLSLLDRMTPKLIRRYHKKGIFTVHQLSYVFKPRRSKKRARKATATFNPELQALAIRTGKVYLQKLPEPARHPVELFLDIEGIPDRDFYYLIGLLVCEGENNSYYSFWADTIQDEEKIWTQLLKKVNDYPEVPIYHYGSFDLRAVEKLGRRYATVGKDMLKQRLVNVNSYIFGKVYFPVRSNSLKEIGKFIGATWTSPESSGLQSLVWRYYWEQKRDDHYRQLLLVYNQEDCTALKLMVDELSEIGNSANTLSDIDFIYQPKRHTTKPGEQIHNQFETILKFAHANYDKRKISFRKDEEESAIVKEEKKSGFKKGYHGQRKIRPKATKVVQVALGRVCPRHNESLRPTERIAKRLIIDLVLAKKDIRKTITEYVGFQGYCSKCNRYYAPPDIRKYPANQLYGHGFQAWIVYQRVALRMTYGGIAEAMLEQFNENECGHTIASFITNLGHYYAETEEAIIQRLLKHPFIHVDETPINVRGVTQYVWTFANDKDVAFRLKDTREAIIVREFLADYTGVLISDFYTGYDSIECPQQKCWVHLIRDLNDDLWESPFDMEYGMFISEVRSLIIPIMEAIQKYGLKRWHLNKFMRQVNEFYQKVITDKHYKSELALKYQKRFLRYRKSLFTFLEQDGIPWHNNTAERALRHIAKQQQISGMFREPVTHHYLRLLGIRQACRFQGKSFLKFLMSGEKDVDQFRIARR